jgi:hypothetical protein
MLSKIDQAEPVATLTSDLAALQASYRALNIDEQIKTTNLL